MADFATLSSAANYLTLLTSISDRDKDLAFALDPASTTVTTPPTNAVRYNSANKRWEKYNGSSWAALIDATTDAYAITVNNVRSGNFFGTITNNGTISGGIVDVTTLKQGGSAAWTAATLSLVSQLINDSGYLTSASLAAYLTTAAAATTYAALAGAAFSGNVSVAGTMFVGATSGSGGKFEVTVADTAVAQRLKAATATIRIRPYIDATYGALVESVNAAESAYLPLSLSASVLRVYTGSSLAALFDGSGNLGVGTTPGVRLHVDSGVTDEIARFNATNNPLLSVHKSNVRQFYLQGTGSSVLLVAEPAIPMLFYTNSAERMRIDASGNVGIGTASPSTRLQIGDSTVQTLNRLVFGKAVAASESFLPAIGQQSFGGAGNDLAFASTSTSGVLRFFTGASTNSGEIGTGANTERMRIDSSGNVSIGTGSPAYTTAGRTVAVVNGSSNSLLGLMAGGVATGYILATATDFGMYSDGASKPLLLGTNGTERLRIIPSGLVGIGRTPTTYALEVNGDVQATNFRGALVGTASGNPTLTGTGASGTWGISISGVAASASAVTWANVSSKPINSITMTTTTGTPTGGSPVLGDEVFVY
jgi:hypothetical protein